MRVKVTNIIKKDFKTWENLHDWHFTVMRTNLHWHLLCGFCHYMHSVKDEKGLTTVLICARFLMVPVLAQMSILKSATM